MIRVEQTGLFSLQDTSQFHAALFLFFTLSQCSPSSSSLIIRERASSPGFESQTGLLPGMLKRTKYSRLRNDSLTSPEGRPQRMLSLKRDLCFKSDFALLDPGTPTHCGPSTLRDFIPRVTNIRLQSPISPHGLRGQTVTARDGTTDGHTDRLLSRAEWDFEPNQRVCSQPSPSEPPSVGQNLTHSALSCTTRPITLHHLPWIHSSQHRPGLCCLKTSNAVDQCTVVRAANRAVHHGIKYLGSVEVTQSMRTLDFETRIQITREAISRLCEKTSARTAVKAKSPVCKGQSAVLGQINLQFSGRRIILAVSTDSMTLMAASSLQKIAHHPMHVISFASGGDPDMADYIAYVAKDLFNLRACHILECPQGRASEVINSIGQAFEGRFRQLLKHTPSLLSTNARSAVTLCHKWHPEETNTDQKNRREGDDSEPGDYYNVTPGEMPAAGKEDLQTTRQENKLHADNKGVSLYENCSTTEGSTSPPTDSVESELSAEKYTLPSETQIQDMIQEEGWFHGRLGRQEAESLLTCSGDFLVRESSASGQYVLSGMQGGSVRHLLLVDGHGQVRTRDQVFLSVGHLVRFHMENRMPLVSGSSELCLKRPVLQRH